MKQKEVVREDGERRKTVIHEKGPAHVCECMRVCLCVRACVCLAVMTLCLWAVYLPQQRKAKKKKMDDASLTQTDRHTHNFSFPLLCSNCLPPVFSLPYTCTQTHTHMRVQTHTLISPYKASFFLFQSCLIFPPTPAAIWPLMMQLEHAVLPTSCS